MKVFDNINLLIVVLLTLGTGLYGFLLGGNFSAAIWGEPQSSDMTGMMFVVTWTKHLAIAAPFALVPYWLSKWILRKLGLES